MKNFKNLLLLLASAFCLSANAALSDTDYGSNNYIEEWGRLKLVGNQLSSESGEPVQLMGWSSFSTHYSEVGGCLTEDQFRQMKAWGANIVRMAMYLNDYGGYMANKNGETQKMKEYIDWTANVGIYCMVDWHVLETTGGQSGDPHTYLNDAKNFFSEISKYVKDNGYKHVIYEICNEPDQKAWSNVKSYADALLPSIAANDPNAVVIVGTPSWDQQILAPLGNKVQHSTLQIMYAFHYYACSHEGLLGNFSSATASLPVFVSEWSGVTFNGDGSLCEGAADKLLGYCNKQNDGEQLVSWCFWNWGFKKEGSSTFNNSCSTNNLTTIGYYIVKRMGGVDVVCCCCSPGPRPKIQKIPASKDFPFQVGYYNYGGEGVAYHDKNSGTFVKNEDGEITGYKMDDPANNGGTAEALNCNATIEYGNEFRLGKLIDTFAYGKQWTQVPDVSDNCVDVSVCFGPGEENAGDCFNLTLTEEGEWANYTIDVQKAGYYKVSALTNLASSNASYFTLLKNGPKGGCLVRDFNNKENYDLTELYLTSMVNCDWTSGDTKNSTKDPNAWKCWEWNDITNEEGEPAYVLFTEEGEQEIKLLIGPASIGDMGPLAFEFVEGIENAPEDDPLFRGSTEVSKVVANSGSIYSVENGIITISANEAGSATISTAAGTSKVVNIAKGDNKINVAPGLYIVNLTTASNSKAVKVLVK